MIDFTIETEIARPVPMVFAYVTNPALLSTWQTNTVSAVALDDGPLGVGTQLREVHRGPGGRQLASLVEVSTYEIDREFALHVLEGALPIDAHIKFTPTTHGTRLVLRAYGRPTGALRLAQPLLRRALRRQFTGYCNTLKQVLQADAGTAIR